MTPETVIDLSTASMICIGILAAKGIWFVLMTLLNAWLHGPKRRQPHPEGNQ